MTREHSLQHLRIVEIQIGLVRIEPVPVIGAGFRVPGPVGLLGIEKDDARAGVFLIVVGPDVEIAVQTSQVWRCAGALKPWMLVRGVVDHQLGDHPQAALVRLVDKAAHIRQRAIIRMHAAVVGDVVTVVAARRGIEGQQPDRGDAEIGDVVELGDQSGKIADAVVIGVEEGLDVKLVDDRILVPKRILMQSAARLSCGEGSGAFILSHGETPPDQRTAARRDRA